MIVERLSFIFFSSLSVGAVVSTTRKTIKACGEKIITSDYRIAFYVFAGCMTCCVITCLFFKFQVRKYSAVKRHYENKPI